MSNLNIEIKARCANPDRIRKYLVGHHAVFKGVDHQTDTYFNVQQGRLKLREGNIENNLIYYERNNHAGPRSSVFRLIKMEQPLELKEILVSSLGIKTIIRKKREIYFLHNVKFHLDEVEGLGTFMEIEAGNLTADIPEESLRMQCDHYIKELGIRHGDMIDVSYSDMILEEKING
jgi:adenylate cyclase, class 2